MDHINKQKYLKYKNKYLSLKNQIGGASEMKFAHLISSALEMKFAISFANLTQDNSNPDNPIYKLGYDILKYIYGTGIYSSSIDKELAINKEKKFLSIKGVYETKFSFFSIILTILCIILCNNTALPNDKDTIIKILKNEDEDDIKKAYTAGKTVFSNIFKDDNLYDILKTDFIESIDKSDTYNLNSVQFSLIDIIEIIKKFKADVLQLRNHGDKTLLNSYILMPINYALYLKKYVGIFINDSNLLVEYKFDGTFPTNSYKGQQLSGKLIWDNKVHPE